MKKIFRNLIITTCTLVIAACASSGKKLDMNVVDSFIPGKTTIQEATEKLGKPVIQNQLPNNEVIIGWNYIFSSPLGVKSRSATIKFSSDGVMKQVLSKTEIGD